MNCFNSEFLSLEHLGAFKLNSLNVQKLDVGDGNGGNDADDDREGDEAVSRSAVALVGPAEVDHGFAEKQKSSIIVKSCLFYC